MKKLDWEKANKLEKANKSNREAYGRDSEKDVTCVIRRPKKQKRPETPQPDNTQTATPRVKKAERRRRHIAQLKLHVETLKRKIADKEREIARLEKRSLQGEITRGV